MGRGLDGDQVQWPRLSGPGSAAQAQQPRLSGPGAAAQAQLRLGLVAWLGEIRTSSVLRLGFCICKVLSSPNWWFQKHRPSFCCFVSLFVCFCQMCLVSGLIIQSPTYRGSDLGFFNSMMVQKQSTFNRDLL